jgi:hypothetical protein
LNYVTHICSVKSSDMTKPAIADSQLVSKLTTAVGDLIRNMS